MKLKYTLAICWVVVSLLLLSGCDESGTEYEGSSIQVVSAEVTFQPTGGIGTIVIEAASQVSAVSNKEWCVASVSGNTVAVTVGKNDEITGRTAALTIRSGADEVIVPVTQLGTVLWLDGLDFTTGIIDLSVKGGSVTGTVKINTDYEVKIEEDWLTWTVDGDEFTLSATSSNFQNRQGVITFVIGEREQTYTVRQIRRNLPYMYYEEFIGDYTLSYVNDFIASGVSRTRNVKIEPLEEEVSYIMTGDLDWPIVLKYEENAGRFALEYQQLAVDPSDNTPIVLWAFNGVGSLSQATILYGVSNNNSTNQVISIADPAGAMTGFAYVNIAGGSNYLTRDSKGEFGFNYIQLRPQNN